VRGVCASGGPSYTCGANASAPFFAIFPPCPSHLWQRRGQGRSRRSRRARPFVSQPHRRKRKHAPAKPPSAPRQRQTTHPLASPRTTHTHSAAMQGPPTHPHHPHSKRELRNLPFFSIVARASFSWTNLTCTSCTFAYRRFEMPVRRFLSRRMDGCGGVVCGDAVMLLGQKGPGVMMT
jgi:hypothetical protein